MARRRKRPFQITCRCGAYHFPHRIGGGKCTGDMWAEAYHLYVSNQCRHCNCNHNGVCEVGTGAESLKHCEAYMEAMRAEKQPEVPMTEEELAGGYDDYYDESEPH